jgi:hypothetical protein
VVPGVGAFGVVVGCLAAGGFILGLLQPLGAGATIIGAMCIWLAVTSAVTRLLLRLEPIEYGDRGGPS